MKRSPLVLLLLSLAGCGAAGEEAVLPAADAGPDAGEVVSRAGGWTRLEAAGGPSPRSWHAMTIDDGARRVYLFGGRDEKGPLGDLWVLDLATTSWRRIDAAGPGPRWGHGAAVGAGTLWVFGGQDDAGLRNDVWAFDLARESWSRREPAGDAPAVRYGFGGAVYDAARGRFIITHGFAAGGRHDDSWAFGGDAWTSITPSGDRPLKRCLHDTAWGEGRLFLYGGCSSGFGPCPQGDLWMLDPAGGWTELAAPGGPAPRQNPSLVYAGGKVIVLFGNAGGDSDEVWSYDLAGASWTRIEAAGPTARSQADAVYDAAGDRILVFGGLAAGAPAGDLWALDF